MNIGKLSLDQAVWLAPMTGISDLPFRRMAGRLGIAYTPTEMVASALLNTGRADIDRKIALDDAAKVRIVQLIGSDPQALAQAARLAQSAGADLIDFNLGCPAREVTGVQCGSALMRDPNRAERLMGAIRDAVNTAVTIKMRLGWDDTQRNAPEIAARAQNLGLDAITIHGRTRQQFYKDHADWRGVADVVQAVSIPVIVNGDILDKATHKAALEQSGAVAAMIGRGACGQPWFVAELNGLIAPKSLEDRIQFIIEHFELSLNFYGPNLGLKVFRKHLGWYIDHLPAYWTPLQRRALRVHMCRIEAATELVKGLKRLDAETYPSGAMDIAAA